MVVPTSSSMSSAFASLLRLNVALAHMSSPNSILISSLKPLTILSICLDRHVIEDSDVVFFCYCFRIVFIPLVYSVHIALPADIPVEEGCDLILPADIVCLCEF